MTPLHVISGMSGAVMVLPREGLRDKTGKLLHYDRVYYIGENGRLLCSAWRRW
jgi:nitrite reductase (NO-forming)